MTQKYFGTDGIRGEANSFPMRADIALKVAMATAYVLRKHRNGSHMNRVVIGKDTRISCYMLEQAMAAGFGAMGMEVFLTGPIPTPAIARLTTTFRADAGVIISASHNCYRDNGIKIFGSDGYKLPDTIENEIEKVLDSDFEELLPSPDEIGKATRIDDAQGRYIEYVKNTFPKGQTLKGFKIVVDCANGAAYKVAPQLFWELEAEVIPLSCNPNGKNINKNCGATDTRLLQQKVVEEKADIGIALDGDADRLIMVDEKGQKIDGDQIMALLAINAKENNALNNNAIVSTVMSNLGLEKFLQKNGIKLIRTKVGDRYVMEEMKANGYNIGGEQSGHLILSDFGTTGDALVAAMQVLAIIKKTDKPVSRTCKVFDTIPQTLENIKFSGNNPLADENVKNTIKAAEEKLGKSGRILVRKSGTEPLIRVMVEAKDTEEMKSITSKLCDTIRKVAN